MSGTLHTSSHLIFSRIFQRPARWLSRWKHLLCNSDSLSCHMDPIGEGGDRLPKVVFWPQCLCCSMACLPPSHTNNFFFLQRKYFKILPWTFHNKRNRAQSMKNLYVTYLVSGRMGSLSMGRFSEYSSSACLHVAFSWESGVTDRRQTRLSK